jgi:hypothetical protein
MNEIIFTQFYCKRVEAEVDWQECEDCDYFRECKKDGYLSEVDQKLGISPAFKLSEKQSETFRKKLQRALNPNYLDKAKKDTYRWKITGVTDLPKTPFTHSICEGCKNMQQLIDELGMSFNQN